MSAMQPKTPSHPITVYELQWPLSHLEILQKGYQKRISILNINSPLPTMGLDLSAA